MNKLFNCIVLLCFTSVLMAQEHKFSQLYDKLSTPNVYRTASGAPGHQYYQNTADYQIKVELDDKKQKIKGEETITYNNHSKDTLFYLWMQLDQNKRHPNSDSYKAENTNMYQYVNGNFVQRMSFMGGFEIEKIEDKSGKIKAHTINKTMMRIDLNTPLAPNSSMRFSVKWHYLVQNRLKLGGRCGYEHFEKDKMYLYTIAQFYPRMCVYNDVEGWQNKAFLGNGEFTLPFGDYDVSITLPEHYVVGATGNLINPKSVLTKTQIQRLENAQKNTKTPTLIITPKEAEANKLKPSNALKTWHFSAQNVRDFAWAASKKFIWDAMAVKQNDQTIMAMSYYPKEGNPMWEKYSTRAVAQTLKTYSKHTVDYPYPVAISVNAKEMGMEYPMICFNFGRTDEGKFTDYQKYRMISVIIHEVGHNYFPMIINSDERQWTWMDEGLNTFVQYLTEQEFEKGYPSRRGPAYKIVDYMSQSKADKVPIMTNSESLLQFGNNAYGKPATALNILRETIMGKELFDFAFKTYAKRWKFKHPTPSDFFRTMEDASGVDLDWFWRGWFYSNDHVDIAIDKVRAYKLSGKKFKSIKFGEDKTDKKYPTKQKQIFKNKPYVYEIDFSNQGGIVMPIILGVHFKDGTYQKLHLPAEIWVLNTERVRKVFGFEKPVEYIDLDPDKETADTQRRNNLYPKSFFDE